MNAVRFVGRMMGTSGYPVALIHVFRIADPSYGELQSLFFAEDWFETAENAIREKVEKAKALLVQSSFSKDLIDIRIIRDAHSRAGSIASEVERYGFGYIVIGRRGLFKVQEFVMGRVSSKVIQLARKSTVWVIPEPHQP